MKQDRSHIVYAVLVVKSNEEGVLYSVLGRESVSLLGYSVFSEEDLKCEILANLGMHLKEVIYEESLKVLKLNKNSFDSQTSFRLTIDYFLTLGEDYRGKIVKSVIIRTGPSFMVMIKIDFVRPVNLFQAYKEAIDKDHQIKGIEFELTNGEYLTGCYGKFEKRATRRALIISFPAKNHS